jgi:hypothetical protein
MKVIHEERANHPAWYVIVFVLQDEETGAVALRRRTYFPGGDFLTDPDITCDGSEGQRACLISELLS